MSFALYALDVSTALTIAWVLTFDLGLKIAAAAVLWALFQRRARADRLDF